MNTLYNQLQQYRESDECKYCGTHTFNPQCAACAGDRAAILRPLLGIPTQQEEYDKLRKETPLFSGVRAYFPDALEAVARVSFIGNEQHNPGTALHWDRSKSKQEYDSADRHLNDRAKGIEFDTDGQRHMAKAAWRCLAALQKEIENERTDEG